MASTFVSENFAILTADSTATGLVTLQDNHGWIPGCVVWIAATGETSLECVIVEQVGSTQLRLRRKDSSAQYGRSDVSLFTVAKTSTLNMEGQVVAILNMFEPRAKA